MIAWAGAERLALGHGRHDGRGSPRALAARREAAALPARIRQYRARGFASRWPHRKQLRPVAVIGAGAWGTALAAVAARAGRTVTLYARDASHAAHIARRAKIRDCPASGSPQTSTITNDIATAAAPTSS